MFSPFENIANFRDGRERNIKLAIAFFSPLSPWPTSFMNSLTWKGKFFLAFNYKIKLNLKHRDYLYSITANARYLNLLFRGFKWHLKVTANKWCIFTSNMKAQSTVSEKSIKWMIISRSHFIIAPATKPNMVISKKFFRKTAF